MTSARQSQPTKAALAAAPGAMTTAAALVCKQGVSLGLLTTATRHQALALAWRCLPVDAALTEGQVNSTLRSFLDRAGQFLRTDHVELRRWLVDAGWLSRDGYGREYRAVAIGQLDVWCHDAALALVDLDVNEWAQGVRERALAAAHQRRMAWADPQRSAEADGPRGAGRTE